MPANILVTGGAGYIGSHTTRQLVRAGFNVVVADNLYSGHRWAVDPKAAFFELDAGDSVAMGELMRTHRIDAVVHFAGHIVVPESVANPLKYYRNNSIASASLIQSCLEYQVAHFLFSSSAAVYGQPPQTPIDESTPTSPINPYGRSKLITEWALEDVANSTSGSASFRYIALRYFNVAGASLDAKLGQSTPEATHLIKVACEAACGRRPGVEVFGQDYPTPDGTCIRDYIHVEDLATAHVNGLRYLLEGGDSTVVNCGYGRGFSVREVLDLMTRISDRPFPIADAPRRAGDPAELVAASGRIRDLLAWAPKYNDLELICKTALAWEKSQG